MEDSRTAARLRMEGYRKKRRLTAIQAPVVVSPSAVSSSWTTRPVPSSATSRALVRNSLPHGPPTSSKTNCAQSVRTTSSACSSPNARPAACDKRLWGEVARWHFPSVPEFFTNGSALHMVIMRAWMR